MNLLKETSDYGQANHKSLHNYDLDELIVTLKKIKDMFGNEVAIDLAKSIDKHHPNIAKMLSNHFWKKNENN